MGIWVVDRKPLSLTLALTLSLEAKGSCMCRNVSAPLLQRATNLQSAANNDDCFPSCSQQERGKGTGVDLTQPLSPSVSVKLTRIGSQGEPNLARKAPVRRFHLAKTSRTVDHHDFHLPLESMKESQLTEYFRPTISLKLPLTTCCSSRITKSRQNDSLQAPTQAD